MGRGSRQNALIEIISKHDIGTQEELVSRLAEIGYEVTQATISRDIKDLNIVKVALPLGNGYKYVVSKISEDSQYEKFLKIYRSTVVSITNNENMIVIRTEPGSTGPASEFIDNLGIKEILGVIAGENTIFVAVDSTANTLKVKTRLEDLLN